MHEKVAIRTGESVALEFELAGLGSRFLALCVDLFIQAVVVVALVIAYFVFSVTIGQAGARLHLPAAIATSLPIAIMTIIIFILTIGYFIIFEIWWDGRSPGKRALGLRVIRDAGFPIDWGSSVIRNLVRIVEAALGFYALSTVSVLLSKENKRLGDIAAGTIVIRDSGYVAPDYATLAASLNTPVSET
jgi:uncharacterized RDD family membrane protein YckC